MVVGTFNDLSTRKNAGSKVVEFYNVIHNYLTYLCSVGSVLWITAQKKSAKFNLKPFTSTSHELCWVHYNLHLALFCVGLRIIVLLLNYVFSSEFRCICSHLSRLDLIIAIRCDQGKMPPPLHRDRWGGVSGIIRLFFLSVVTFQSLRHQYYICWSHL